MGDTGRTLSPVPRMRRAALLGLVVAAVGCREAASQTTFASTSAAIDRVVADHYPGGWGVELAVYKDGRPLYIHGYGLRDRGLPEAFGGEKFWGVQEPDAVYHLPRSPAPPDSTTIFDL